MRAPVYINFPKKGFSWKAKPGEFTKSRRFSRIWAVLVNSSCFPEKTLRIQIKPPFCKPVQESAFLRGQKKHINFFNNFLSPTRNRAPRKKFMCLISLERTQKRGPHKLFRGDFWGQKRGPKRAIFGHKKFSLLFFSCP